MTEHPSCAYVPFDYVNRAYRPGIKVGTRLLFCDRPATVVEDRGHYLGIQFDSGGDVVSIHPTWSVEYLPDASDESCADKATPVCGHCADCVPSVGASDV